MMSDDDMYQFFIWFFTFALVVCVGGLIACLIFGFISDTPQPACIDSRNVVVVCP